MSKHQLDSPRLLDQNVAVPLWRQANFLLTALALRAGADSQREAPTPPLPISCRKLALPLLLGRQLGVASQIEA